MNDDEKAWRLWHLMQEVSSELWDRYEEAFMKFCMRDNERSGYRKTETGETHDDLPF